VEIFRDYPITRQIFGVSVMIAYPDSRRQELVFMRNDVILQDLPPEVFFDAAMGMPKGLAFQDGI
jgi:hypothetical protein